MGTHWVQNAFHSLILLTWRPETMEGGFSLFFWQIPHEDLFLLSCGPCLIPSQFPARALPIPHFNQIPNYSSPATSSGTLTAAELSVLGALEISAALEDGAVRAPWVLCEGVTQAVYVGCGSAHVYVSSSADGKTLVVDELNCLRRKPVRGAAVHRCVRCRDWSNGVEWVSRVKSSKYVC